MPDPSLFLSWGCNFGPALEKGGERRRQGCIKGGKGQKGGRGCAGENQSNTGESAGAPRLTGPSQKEGKNC